MNNFPEELLKFLDDSKKHLSLNAISQYLNSFNIFNENEIKFFEAHLNECKICKENLYKIFDEELEKSQTNYKINVNLSTKNHLNFTDKENNIEGIVSKEGEIFYLTFINLPHYLLRQNLRVSIPENGLIIRIAAADLNKKYEVYTNEDLNLRNNTEVVLDVNIRKIKNPKRVYKNTNKFLYASAAVFLIFITIYLLIINPNQTKRTKLIKIVEPASKAIADSVPVYADTIRNLDTSKHVEEKVQVAEKNIPQLPAKISPEFKNNSYLENYVNKDKENGIIINPGIGDTMRKQITFKWTPLEAEEYDMSIVNNKNQEIWNKSLADTRVTVFQKFDPGVYYWKISVKGKLETVGKFFVK